MDPNNPDGPPQLRAVKSFVRNGGLLTLATDDLSETATVKQWAGCRKKLLDSVLLRLSRFRL